MTDHKITHTHPHRHTVWHPHALGRQTSSEPHEHEHGHTSIYEAGYDHGAPHHRRHFHVPQNEPRSR